MKALNIKKLAALAAAIVTITSVSGCGVKKAEPQADGKTVVKIWSWVSADSAQWEKDQYERMVKALETELPDISVEIRSVVTGTDFAQEYDKALMAGNAPDYYPGFAYTEIPSRIKNKTIADISDLVNDWDLKKQDRVITTFDEAIKSGDNWYAIPADAYVQGTMGNLKAIKAGGGDITKLPETWAEFAEMGALITDPSVPRYGYELVGMDWCAWPYTAWVWSAGGNMVVPNGDGTYKIAFNEEPGVDAALYLNEMIWKHKMTQKNVLNSYDDILMDIKNGTAAFSWSQLSGLDSTIFDYDLTYDDFVMMPMPVKDSSIKRPVLAGGSVVTFNPKASKETLKAAFSVADFIYYNEKFLLNEWEILNASGDLNIMVPPVIDLFEKKLAINTSLSESAKSSIVEMGKNSIAEPFCPHWIDLKNKLVNPLQEIYLTENITREKAKDLLDKCAEELYRLYPDAFSLS